MHIVLIAIGVLALIVGVILILAGSKPKMAEVRRSASIQAPAERIHSMINDFRHWAAWSPWEKMDLSMKKVYSGATSGKGAIYEWEGNKKVGQGRMEIIESMPPSKVVIKLDFIKPFEGHNVAEFTIEGRGEMAMVVWSMRGARPLMFRVMGLFMDLDQLIGKDFEAGLANMKALAEKSQAVAALK